MSDAAPPPPLTPDEVDAVAVAVTLELFDPGPAALVATQLARAMKAATTREAQDRAGAKILHTFASVAAAPPPYERIAQLDEQPQ